MMATIKKLIFPSYTDKKVEKIAEINHQVFRDTTAAAKRNSALLKKNGVTLQIILGAGGDHD